MSKRSMRTSFASSGVIPPTGMPEMVTPGGISTGRGSVVVVPVVVVPVVRKPTAPTFPARTTAVSAPAAAQASATTA